MATLEEKTANKGRMAKLNGWLDRNGAMLVWQHGATSVCPMISSYLVHGVVVIVATFKTGGFELFIPASKSNDVSMTLDNAAVFIGPKCLGSAGL